jgi:hypothetical protein
MNHFPGIPRDCEASIGLLNAFDNRNRVTACSTVFERSFGGTDALVGLPGLHQGTPLPSLPARLKWRECVDPRCSMLVPQTVGIGASASLPRAPAKVCSETDLLTFALARHPLLGPAL